MGIIDGVAAWRASMDPLVHQTIAWALDQPPRIIVDQLDGETFSQLMTGNPEIVRGVLHVLCERLRRTSATAGIVSPVGCSTFAVDKLALGGGRASW